MMADDDLFIDDYFIEILVFLSNTKPDMASPQWLRGNDIYRGVETTRKVKYIEYQASCGHAPGVIYNVNRAREFLPLITERVEKNCSAALTYPQVLLCISLLLNGDNCWHIAYPVAKEGHGLPSGINRFFWKPILVICFETSAGG